MRKFIHPRECKRRKILLRKVNVDKDGGAKTNEEFSAAIPRTCAWPRGQEAGRVHEQGPKETRSK
jgi:hypothetical protein